MFVWICLFNFFSILQRQWRIQSNFIFNIDANFQIELRPFHTNRLLAREEHHGVKGFPAEGRGRRALPTHETTNPPPLHLSPRGNDMTLTKNRSTAIAGKQCASMGLKCLKNALSAQPSNMNTMVCAKNLNYSADSFRVMVLPLDAWRKIGIFEKKYYLWLLQI